MPEEVLRRLNIDGLSYSYRLLPNPRPTTEPVLIVGGVRQGMYGWPQMEHQLCPEATVITADLPGMGASDTLRDEHDSSLLCGAIDQIIDDLHTLGAADRVNVFGYSYGAALLFTCTQRRPERVARLMLGGVPSDFSDAQIAYWQDAADTLRAGDHEEFVTKATEGMLCMDPRRHVHRRDLAYRYVRRQLLHNIDSVSEIYRALDERLPLAGGLTGVPTLVFCGEHDTLTSTASQRHFADTITDSTFVSVPDADHWVVLERADVVADLAHHFFTSSQENVLPLAPPVLLPAQR
ncbi:alpha/beta fold hydrolase [Streptomyces sp. NPDC048172]|uniref:alpha/beta fold hydrolase n=1 Tax=Streptomyces sp. NPDC048172 TaxID=3365505 RepID=UPI0037215CA0